MFIFKKAIPRRTMLKALGATVGLPLLDAMIPAATAQARTAAAPVRRFGALFVPMGAVMDKWTPVTTGPNFEMSPVLTPLVAFRDQMVVISGLHRPLVIGSGPHAASASTWLSGVHPKRTEAEDVRNGVTLDQVIAGQIGRDTPFPSLEFGIEDVTGYIGACDVGFSCAYVNTLSWKTPTTPVPMETNPRTAFERLFGRPGTVAQRALRQRQDRSILDSLLDEAAELNQGLNSQDRARLEEYLGNIRELEQRISGAERKSHSRVDVPDAPVGIPESYAEHAQLMFDLLALAFASDQTRVGTFMMAREVSQRVYPEINFTEPHHHVSHHRGLEANLSRLVTVQVFFAQQVAKFLEKLRATPDGDGTLLDHSVLIYGSGMSDSNTHSNENLPLLVAGGGAGLIRGNRHVKVDGPTPLPNVLLDLANKFGAEIDQFGTSTGRWEI